MFFKVKWDKLKFMSKKTSTRVFFAGEAHFHSFDGQILSPCRCPPWNMGTSGGHKATMAKVRKGQLNLRQDSFQKDWLTPAFLKILFWNACFQNTNPEYDRLEKSQVLSILPM